MPGALLGVLTAAHTHTDDQIVEWLITSAWDWIGKRSAAGPTPAPIGVPGP